MSIPRPHSRILFGLLLLTCWLLPEANGQTYNFRVFNDDNGLPQGYIYHLSQDKFGFLYASTGEGLAVYGGNAFKVYRKEDGLAENFVTTHFIDSKNNVWLGHFQEGISIFNRNTNSFVALKNEELKSAKINCITEDSEGNIWVGTLGKGVFMIDPTLNVKAVEEIRFNNVTSILAQNNGELIVGTSEGVSIYGKRTNNKVYEMLQTFPELSGNTVVEICTSNDNSLIWMAVSGKGVYSFKKSRSGYYINTVIRADLAMTDYDFRSIFCDNKNNLWVAAFGEGIRKISLADNEGFSYTVFSYTQKNGLVNDYVQSVYCDFEGNTWIGTYGSGLAQLMDEKFVYFDPVISEQEKTKENPIYAVTMDKQGNLFLGTTHGFEIFPPAKKDMLTELFDAKHGFIDDKVNALYADQKGIIWIGTAASGIYTFDPATRKFQNISAKYKLQNQHINFITGNGITVFIGTSEGLYQYNVAGDAFSLLSTEDGLLHNNILHVYVDRFGKTWLASHSAPPYNYFNGEVTAFKDIPELKTFNINSICEDKNGKTWFATEGDGVFEFDGNTFKNYTVNDGLASNYCYSLVCTDNNTVWVGHKNGLSRKNEGAKKFLSFGKHQGILSQQTNLNAVYLDPGGNIWYGTTDGLIKYDVEKDRFNSREPSTLIMGMNINNTACKLTADTVLPYKSYSVRFDFIGICLSNPENVRYQYILEGFDPEWNETDARIHTANYPKLEDGKYTFKVLSCNNDGVWNTTPVTYTFVISKPIWKTFWFFAVLFVLLSVSVFFTIKWRTRSLVNLSVRLERMVDEKTYLLKKEKENMEKINILVEEQNRDITDSILYAKKIQEAMLPSRKEMLSKINAFILYKPRDIVSGDFYWFLEVGDELIVAVVDCTGHGVPGAFMSLIGSTLLNKIVKDGAQTRPSKILEALNANIVEQLHQDTDQYSTKDGMEAGICSINLKKNRVTFAGAGRPMYLVRNNELTVYSGSLHSVGGQEGVQDYQEHTVELQKNDTIYLFSDGYSDQFGGDKNRKFSTRRLKEFLLYISELEISEQEKALNETFERWKGDTIQIDDVLVLGIKI